MIHSRRKNNGNRKSLNNLSTDYQPLEPRNLLASFVGTEAADVVVVTFVGGVPQSIEINGDVSNNPDPTLDIDLMGGADQISFLGTGIDLVVEGAVLTSELAGSGSANGVVDFAFDNSIAITTSTFADTVEITGGGLEGFRTSIDTGNGNDVVTFHGGNSSIELGNGDDHVNFTVNFFDSLSYLGGGEGDDTWEFIGTNGRLEFRGVDENGQAVFGFPCCFDGDPFGLSGYYGGIEKVVAPDPTTLELDNRVFAHTDRSGISNRVLSFQFERNVATAADSRLTVPLTIENFNSFRSGQDDNGNSYPGSLFSILSTAYDLTVENYSRIEVGFAEDPKTGDTSNVSHILDLRGETLVVSDFLGLGHDIKVDRNSQSSFFVSGLTGQPVQYNSNIQNVTLWGADNGADRFFIEENQARLTLYGGGFSDAFHIGGQVKQDLDLINTRVVNIVGGLGTDVIYVHDDNSTGKHSFRLRDRWVFHAPDPRGEASREFVGLWYVEATGLTVNGNAEANIFRITPSLDVSYNVNGGFPYHGDGDKLMLVGNVPDHQLLFQTATYWFGPPNTGLPRSIRYSGIDQLAEHGRVAIGSAAGSSSFVEVYDEWSREKVFDIQPYSPGFIGGVNVATGSIVPGPTPSIVTVPASNGFGIVKIFDGRTSVEHDSFEVFGGDHGGYDIAVGNVLGDSRHEIIVSQLQSSTHGNGNNIEVWEQVESEGQTSWVLNRTYDPFANAPKIGTRISVDGDFNFDGYHDIVAGAGPGWLPQVAIHSVVQNTQQLHRFLAHDKSFSGGVYVAAANLMGNRKADVVVSLAPDDRVPAPNLIRTFRGERLYQNAGGTVLAPDLVATPFGGNHPTSVMIFDADFDERADHIFAAISGPNSSGRIKVLDSQFSQIDFFHPDDVFLGGLDLG